MASGLHSALGRNGKAVVASLSGWAIMLFARIVTTPGAIWAGIEPLPGHRVYFVNHTPNGDFVLLWTVLPPHCAAAPGRDL